MTTPTKSRPYFKTPDQLLKDLGITSPEEIDVEAIAFHCGATIRYCLLSGCAARIIGTEASAIIAVDSNSPIAKQRFSGAHELGHWMHDRGKASFGCREEQLLKEWSVLNPEHRANRYASDLLLPIRLFAPIARTCKVIDFGAVRALADRFSTSLTATVIRLVEHGPFPTVVACYTSAGREWFIRNPNIPESLWPSQKLEKCTCAFNLLRSNSSSELKSEVAAEAWFQHRSTAHYLIGEHSIKVSNDTVLTLLWWKDEQMLIDIQEYEERRATRRTDGREEE